MNSTEMKAKAKEMKETAEKTISEAEKVIAEQNSKIDEANRQIEAAEHLVIGADVMEGKTSKSAPKKRGPKAGKTTSKRGRKPGSKNTKTKSKTTGKKRGRKPGNSSGEALHEVVLQKLQKNKSGMTLEELTTDILKSGYKTSSDPAKFSNSVAQAINKLRQENNVESEKVEGSRQKRYKAA